jgi:hypothetical protein
MPGASSSVPAKYALAGRDVGDPGEELLVEALAEADRRGADALVARAARHRDERLGLGDASVREPVGEQEHRLRADPAGDGAELLDALQPAAGEIGHAAGLDPVEGLLELLLVVADLGEGQLEADLVVVGHDGEPVGGRQAPREVGGGRRSVVGVFGAVSSSRQWTRCSRSTASSWWSRRTLAPRSSVDRVTLLPAGAGGLRGRDGSGARTPRCDMRHSTERV